MRPHKRQKQFPSMPFPPMPYKIKYRGPKEECDIGTAMALVEGFTNFVKFKILDTYSRTYEYTVRELVHIWKEEKKVLSVIDMVAKSKNFNPVDTATFFYYHTVFYLHFGKFGWVEHTDLEPLQTTCPFTDTGNFMTMLARNKVCLRLCYSDYILAAAGEFGYHNITSIYEPGHVFPAVVDNKQLYFALEEGFENDLLIGMTVYDTAITKSFIERFDAPNFIHTTVESLYLNECTIAPHNWVVFISILCTLSSSRETLTSKKSHFQHYSFNGERDMVTWKIISHLFRDEYQSIRKILNSSISGYDSDMPDSFIPPLKKLMEVGGKQIEFSQILFRQQAKLIFMMMIGFDIQYENASLLCNNSKQKYQGISSIKMENGEITAGCSILSCIKELDRGKHGVVSLYSDGKIEIVIKKCREDDFEIKLLNHSDFFQTCGVVAAKHLGNYEGMAYIAMDKLDGTLEEYIEQEKEAGRYTLDKVYEIIEVVSKMLICLSEEEFFYTDIKIENIMFKKGPELRLYLVDIGSICTEESNLIFTTFQPPLIDCGDSVVTWGLLILFLRLITDNDIEEYFRRGPKLISPYDHMAICKIVSRWPILELFDLKNSIENYETVDLVSKIKRFISPEQRVIIKDGKFRIRGMVEEDLHFIRSLGTDMLWGSQNEQVVIQFCPRDDLIQKLGCLPYINARYITGELGFIVKRNLPNVAELIKEGINESLYLDIVQKVLSIADDLDVLGYSFDNISLKEVMYDEKEHKVYVGSSGLIKKKVRREIPTHLYQERERIIQL
jgi:hypothetical protein